MDNAGHHNMEAIASFLRSRGHFLLALPPWSPELMPMEGGFGLIKSSVKKDREQYKWLMNKEISLAEALHEADSGQT